MADERLEVITNPTPGDGAVKTAQILLRRKLNSQWESLTEKIPAGEPCFSYDPTTGEYILKIGAQDAEGNLQTWN